MGGVVSPYRVDGFRFCCGAGARLIVFFLFSCASTLPCFSTSRARLFSLRGQRKGSKRKATLLCWPSAFLCASAYSGRCGTRCAQTVLALFRSKLPVLDNTKGKVRPKTRSKSDRWQLTSKYTHTDHTTIMPAQAGIQNL